VKNSEKILMGSLVVGMSTAAILVTEKINEDSTKMQTKTEIQQPPPSAEAVAQSDLAGIWVALFVILLGLAIGIFSQRFLDRIYWKILWRLKGFVDEQIKWDIDLEKHHLEYTYRQESAKK
jgi:hypothetical protein